MQSNKQQKKGNVDSYCSMSYSAGKSKRQDKKHRRYRKIGMHRLKSTHLLTEELIEAVS